MTCHCVQDGTQLRKNLGSLQVGSEKCESGDAGDRSSIGSEDEEHHEVDALLFFCEPVKVEEDERNVFSGTDSRVEYGRCECC